MNDCGVYNWPLHAAGMKGDVKEIERLVGEGVDPNIKMTTKFNSEPLSWAASFGQLGAIIALIKAGADPFLPPNQAGFDTRKDAVRERHHHVINFLDEYKGRAGIGEFMKVKVVVRASVSKSVEIKSTGSSRWEEHQNIDMCGQGDVEIIPNWRASYSIDSLKRIVEEKGYSAISIGTFQHAALKKFDYQLTAKHCGKSSMYTNQFFIYFPGQSGGGARKLSAGYNEELNSTARNTNDVAKIRGLVKQGADLLSTNGPEWRHTPLHQAAYHGRPKVVQVLIELSRNQGVLEKLLGMDSNPCGRGARGTPIELARGGGHQESVLLLEEAARSIDNNGNTEEKVSDNQNTFNLSGWVGYNSRFNGRYDIVDGLTVEGRPVYRHTHSIGVGAHCDWCRVWWHQGVWRIGHVAWISENRMLNVAHIKSNAQWPGAITPRTCN